MASTTLGKRQRCPLVSTNSSTPAKRVRHSGRQANAYAEIHIHADDVDEIGKSDQAHSETAPSLPTSTSLAQDENASANIPTPKTPRRRDAISKHIPTTPRHRIDLIVQAAINANTPEKLPLTPATPRNVYAEAKRVFSRGAYSGPLVGRDNEITAVQSFLGDCFATSQGNCLYVSGPPGTGKSALVGQICRDYTEKHPSLKYATVNCMSVKTASDIYSTLRDELTPENMFTSTGQDALQNRFVNTEDAQMYLIMLDEIDQLLNLDASVLYSLFDWSMNPNSRLILIGISNALDLTDRFLPKLKARNLKPQLMPFLPYSVQQIAAVLSARAQSLLPASSSADPNFVPFLMPPAIQLISKKVASQSGDLRKAFDIAQRAITLIETETHDKEAQKLQQQTPQSSPIKIPLAENPNLSSPRVTPSPKKQAKAFINASFLQAITFENAPRATISHVIRVTSAAFNNGTSQRLSGLNLQQKAVLCAMAALEQKKRLDTTHSAAQVIRITPSPSRSLVAPTIRAVYDAYSLLCRRENLLTPLSLTEFRDVLSNLETSSLVSTADGKGSIFNTPSTPSRKGRGSAFGSTVKADDKRVSSIISAEELMKSLSEGPGVDVLKRMLSGQC